MSVPSARASPARAPERLSVRNATGARAGGDVSARAASAVRAPARASTGNLTGARAGGEGRLSISTEGRLSSSSPWENRNRDGARPSSTPAAARSEQRADARSGGASHAEFELAAQREVNADIMTHLQHCKADLQREKVKTASLQTDLEAARLVLRKEKDLNREGAQLAESRVKLAASRERERDRDSGKGKKALPSVQEDEVLRLKLEADEAKDALLEALEAKTKEADASSGREQEALAQLELLKDTIVAARQDAARQTRALAERSSELEARLDAACSEAAAAASAAAELQAEMGVLSPSLSLPPSLSPPPPPPLPPPLSPSPSLSLPPSPSLFLVAGEGGREGGGAAGNADEDGRGPGEGG